jgi:hypothetical protein
MLRCLVVLALLLLPATVMAQDGDPALVVTLRDLSERGVAEVIIEVRDGEGAQTLLREMTDAEGVARFSTLPDLSFRILPVGQSPSGEPLTLPGADADRGIPAFSGTGGTVQIDLLVEAGGTVRIDPFRMLPLEPADEVLPAPTLTALAEAISEAPYPGTTAMPAAAAVQPTPGTGSSGAAMVAPPTPVAPPEPIALADPDRGADGGWVRVLLSILLVLLVAGGFFWFRRHGKAS